MSPTARRVIAAAFLAALSLGAGSGRSYEPGAAIGVLPEVVAETSGLTEGSADDGVMFTHNDSSDLPYDPANARIFAVDHAGELVATLQLLGVGVTDPEDIAWGPGGAGQPALYLADIGDNYRVRPQIWLYVVDEPVLDAASRDQTIEVNADDITTYTLTYPDGPHDAETLLVHPTTGEVTVVTKSSDGLAGIYTAPRPTGSGAAVLTRRGTLDLNPIWTQASHNPEFTDSQYLTTGGEISHDAAWVTIRTYTEAFEWPLGADGDVATAVATTPVVVTIPPESQGEAIAYERSGGALLTTSENTRIVHRMALATAPSTPPEPEPSAPEAPAPVVEDLPQTGGGAAAVSLALTAVAATMSSSVFGDRRRSRQPAASCEPS